MLQDILGIIIAYSLLGCVGVYIHKLIHDDDREDFAWYVENYILKYTVIACLFSCLCYILNSK